MVPPIDMILLFVLIAGSSAFSPPKTLLRVKSTSISVAALEPPPSVNVDNAGEFKISINDNIATLLPEQFPIAKVGETVYEAVEKMNIARRGSVLVVDDYDSNNFAGIFTERDFVKKIFDDKKDATTTRIEDVMTAADNCDVISPSMTISESREVMMKLNRRRMPVISKSNKAIGVVSLRDIIRALQEEDKKEKIIRATVKDAVADAKSLANQAALASKDELAKQDIFRSVFVLAASVVGAGLAQGDWIRSHEYEAMIATFGLGYVGIILETFLSSIRLPSHYL